MGGRVGSFGVPSISLRCGAINLLHSESGSPVLVKEEPFDSSFSWFFWYPESTHRRMILKERSLLADMACKKKILSIGYSVRVCGL